MENEQRKYWFFGSKLNSVLLIVLIVLMVFALKEMRKNQEFYKQNLGLKDSYQIPVGDTAYEKDNENSYPTYTYTNHGFSIELPKGFIPKETQGEGGPGIHISLPGDSIVYYPDALYWGKYVLPSYSYLKDEKIGETIFKVYSDGEFAIYWYQQGNVGYELWGNKDSFKTFKFIGWPQAVSLDLSSGYARTYKTLFTAALQKPADFNGHYVVVSYGCGSGCMAYGIVDKNTGKAYQGPSDDYGGSYQTPSNFDSTRYSLNSNILKVVGYSHVDKYQFDGSKFIRLPYMGSE